MAETWAKIKEEEHKQFAINERYHQIRDNLRDIAYLGDKVILPITQDNGNPSTFWRVVYSSFKRWLQNESDSTAQLIFIKEIFSAYSNYLQRKTGQDVWQAAWDGLKNDEPEDRFLRRFIGHIKDFMENREVDFTRFISEVDEALAEYSQSVAKLEIEGVRG